VSCCPLLMHSNMIRISTGSLAGVVGQTPSEAASLLPVREIKHFCGKPQDNEDMWQGFNPGVAFWDDVN